VDSVETYNALFALWSGAFKWPVIYGKPLTAEQKDRRNYAGIWAGNVRLEICGPYGKEFEPQGVHARLHGLTFRPYDTAANSAAELERFGIRRRPVVTWGRPEYPLNFVIFDDPDIVAPLFSISIMETVKRNRDESEHERAQEALIETRGGPLRLKRVREVRVTYSGDAALQKCRRLLGIDGESWPGNGGAGLRFVRGSQIGVEAAVLEVESVEETARVLRSLGLPAVLEKEHVECGAHGVRLLFTEAIGGR
jgi:hypothetical protein